MQRKNPFREKTYKTRLLTVYGTIFFVAICLLGIFISFDKKDRVNEVYATNSPQANDTHFAFSRELENGDHVSIIFNLKDKDWKVYKFSENAELYPKLSKLDGRVLHYSHVSRSTDNRRLWSILKCKINNSSCHLIFTSNKLIGVWTELPNGASLFTSNVISKTKKGYDTVGLDLFHRDATGNIKRLTEFAFYQFGFLNVLKGKIIVAATGPKSHLLEKHFPNDLYEETKIEDVFEIQIDENFNLIIEESIFKPVINTDKKLFKPSTIDDSPFMAVLQRWEAKGYNYRYDLAIYNLNSGELYDLIKAEDFSFSRPTLLNNGRVIYLEYIENVYKIYVYTIATKHVELLAAISAEEIANSNIETLHISK